MKKLIMLAAFAAFGAAGYAADAIEPPAGGPRGGPMRNLTDEQKACVEKAGCPEMKKPGGEKPETRERGEKPARPEMTAEEKEEMDAARECRKKAFEDCGVEMPERPEGGRPPFEGEGKPPRPQE
ncbi:MAG: hypothetical protein LBL21_00865 [Rickettsiales bacterium]|jgi:hypothetical protein|nr:hypothetical protein [Rickettsiales bacterium]